MDRNDRDEVEIDRYFSEFEKGVRITSLDYFKARIGFEVIEGQSPRKILEHFWQASRAASMISSLNKFASDTNTKVANKFMSRKLASVYEIFLSHIDGATTDDLEKIMATHVRLQTVPTPEFMVRWTAKALGHIDELSDAWFKANFDHFTKLGIYPHDELIHAWWERTASRIADFEPVDQFPILYKMATFDFLRTNDFADVYAGVESPCRRIADHVFGIIEPQAFQLFPETINNQVFFAGLWFGKDFVRGRPIAGNDGAFASVFEDVVAKSIGATSIGVNYNGLLVPVTGHKVDFKLRHDGKFYGCEVDGISHFNRIAGATPHENAVIYNASTRFHSWLTAQYLTYVNVVRIPYFLFDEKEKNIPWEKTLSRIGRKDGHSIYTWHGGSIARDLLTEKNAHLFRGHDL